MNPGFNEVFAGEAGPGGVLPFDRFCDLALYHPEVGYYRRDRKRVGREPGTDFHTATSINSVFGTLIAAACADLVGRDDASRHTFVEVGAEPGAGVLDGVAHAFREARTIRLGEPMQVEGPCVVFSNELFDAQPFVRLVFSGGEWQQIGVRLEGGVLREVVMPAPDGEAVGLIERLPKDAIEGYHLDFSPAAARLASRIAAQPWHGLFVACDYGRSWRELTEDSPHGTARAYRAHKQHNDLLADPGEQDLTCHVCWDDIIAALSAHEFANESIESQEAFFINNARAAVEAIVTGASRGPDPRRMQMQQLLHPALMGQKFQVLTALRARTSIN